MSEADLFGQPIAPHSEPANGKRRPTPKRGYAAPPGTGPIGEYCKTCEHLARVKCAKVYLKCALEKHRWTGGPGTDVAAKSPACSKWEKAK